MNLIQTIQQLAVSGCGPQKLADKIKSTNLNPPVYINAKGSPIGALGVIADQQITALEAALNVNRPDFLLLLLAYGANGIHINNFLPRLIRMRIECSSRFVLEVLQQYFSDTPFLRSFFGTSLTGNQIIFFIMSVVLNTHNIAPDQLNEALLVAILEGDNQELCELLIKSGAKPDWQHAMAAISGSSSVDVMRLLLKNSTVAHARDAEGNTLLHHMAWYGCDKLVPLLLKYDPLMAVYTNCEDKTAVDIAAQQGDYRIGHALLNHKHVAPPDFPSIMQPITLETYPYVIGFLIAYLHYLIKTGQCAVFFESIELYRQHFDTTDRRHIDFLFSARHGLLACMVCYNRFDFLEKLLDHSLGISILWNDVIHVLKQDGFGDEKKACFRFFCDYYARTGKWSEYIAWLYHFSDHKSFATLFCEQVKNRESIIQQRAQLEREQVRLCYEASCSIENRSTVFSTHQKYDLMRQEYDLLSHPNFNKATHVLMMQAQLSMARR